MTPVLLASLFGLALVDSINPSAVAAILFLMSQRGFAAKAAVYIAAIFATYLAVGAAGLLGLDALWGVLSSLAGLVVLTLIGAAMFGYALLAPDKAEPKQDRFAGRSSALGLAGVAAIGVGVTLAELPTALPYAAALALMAEAQLAPAQWAPMLAVYNLIFVAPPALLALAFLILRDRMRPGLERWSQKLSAGARTTMMWLMGIAGFLVMTRAGALAGAELGWIELSVDGVALEITR